jgi:acyl transferase domain-containing protein
MARELLDSSDVFREQINLCDRALAPYLEWSLFDVLQDTSGTPELTRVDVVHPALFAMTVALAALWQSYGVRPAAVIGHSYGEIAGACITGGLSIADGARVAAGWSRAQARLAGHGEVAAVALAVDDLVERIDELPGTLVVAGVNGPASTVVSGDSDAINSMVARLVADGVRATTIPIGSAVHSPQIDAVRDQLLTELKPITPSASTIPFFSSCTGGPLDTSDMQAAYWFRNLRNTVRFQSATRAAIDHGYDVFIEISPHFALTAAVQETAEAAGREVVALGSLQRGRGDLGRFLTALDEARASGASTGGNGRHANAHASGDESLRARVKAMPAAGSQRVLLELVRSHIALVLGEPDRGTIEATRSFSELGFDSNLAVQLRNRLREATGLELSATLLFDQPTPSILAAHLGQRLNDSSAGRQTKPENAEKPTAAGAVPARRDVHRPAVTPGIPGADHAVDDIAIIGMAGRFPGADDVDQFWRNLADGVEAITRFSDEELLASGVDPTQLADASYVRARPVLDDVRGFDAALFGYSPREATMADPQQRVFLECAWSALEQGGYAVPEGRGRVGVFAGANLSTYLLDRFEQFQDEFDANIYELIMGNDKDSLATMTSYKLDLTGPSVSVQTFCSTSLVGVHLACRSLQYGECELALAGGVSIRVPDKIGHLYQPGGMESPDGHVRTFDADARGSLFGDGAAVVLLKPLRDALADRDAVLAVIRGSAMNNDGAVKFGYTAPSVVGQAGAVAAAMADAGVTASDMSYVEAHGTATELGDPMEVAALIRAFGAVDEKQYCAIGSVKTNVGHLDRAAGVTGLIKVVQAMRHRQLPRTLHYRRPNPEIDFASSPFYVTTELAPWRRRAGRPRVAGINSLGMGGTNVHVVVQEAAELPTRPPPDALRRYHILPVSARSTAAAEAFCRSLAQHLRTNPDVELADVAYTLQAGRKVFEHRRVATACSIGEAAVAFGARDSESDRVPPPTTALLQRTDATLRRPTAFLIAGVGEHYPGMVAQLYTREPTFRAIVKECCELLGESFPADVEGLLSRPTPTRVNSDRRDGELARMLGRTSEDGDEVVDLFNHTDIAQPAVFIAEYATARMLMHWGIRPRVMLGYSLGEYVAACLAGVLSLPDALRLVAYRAALIASLPRGAMLAASLTEEELFTRFPDLHSRGLDVAATNGPQLVVAGPVDPVRELAAQLRLGEVACRELNTTHAFHSRMLKPIADQLTDWVDENITLAAPRRRYVSNVTGDIATEELVTDPRYWSRHMCGPVRFAEGLATMLDDPDLAFVEVGAGQSLGALLRTHPACDRSRWPLVTATIPSASDTRPGDAVLAGELSKLWLAGVEIDWSAYHGIGEAPDERDGSPKWRPGRVPLPTYPFQHQDYWLDATRPKLSRGNAEPVGTHTDLMSALSASPRLPEDQWLSIPVWRQTAPRPVAEPGPRQWLLFSDAGPADLVAEALGDRLRESGATVTVVRPGAAFEAGESSFVVRPADTQDAGALLGALRDRDRLPDRVVHLWTLNRVGDVTRHGLHSLVALARAAGELGMSSWALDVVTAGSQRVLGGDEVVPERATALGACRLIPVEYPGVSARLIDVADGGQPPPDLPCLLDEIVAHPADQVVALRDGRRWLPGYDVIESPPTAPLSEANGSVPIRPGGCYLVTGGLGGVGLALAERLAKHYRAKLVLFGRTPVPPREQWDDILAGPGVTAEVRRRLAGLRAIEHLGAEVVVVAGDVSRPDDVRRAITLATKRFGGVNGVLHAAGVPGVGLIQFKTAADIDRVLAPKVAGTVALADALTGQPVDFVALFSSITSATGGGAGQLDYCAANAFLDAFAHTNPLPETRLVSINWGEWTWNGWTDGLDGYDPVLRQFFEEHRNRFGITFDQGWQALLRVLASGQTQVVVSTQDFEEMVRLSRRYTVDDLHAVTQRKRARGNPHPRPDLATPYVAAQTDAELAIADIWASALGLAEVGTADNFFELGGNSLIGVDIVARIRKALKLEQLPPHILYEAPTVGALAKAATGGGEELVAANAERALDRQRRIEMRRRSLRREERV